MCRHIELRIIEYFFLKELFLGLLVHVLFEEVKRSVGLLCFDRFAETLLFLEDGVEILVVGVVATALDVAHLECMIGLMKIL